MSTRIQRQIQWGKKAVWTGIFHTDNEFQQVTHTDEWRIEEHLDDKKQFCEDQSF